MSGLKDKFGEALAKAQAEAAAASSAGAGSPSPLSRSSTAGRSVPTMTLLVQGQIEEANKRAADALARVGQPLLLRPSSLVIVSSRKRQLSSEQLSQLRASVASEGIIEAIRVRPLASGQFEVTSGSNRAEIARELKLDSVPVVIVSDADSDVERKAFYANLYHSPLPDYEKYVGFKREIDNNKLSLADLSARSGVSKTSLVRLMAFDKLPVSTKNIIAARPNDFGSLAVGAILESLGQGRAVEDVNTLLQSIVGEVLPKRLSVGRSPAAKRTPGTTDLKFSGTKGALIALKSFSGGFRIDSKNEGDLAVLHAALLDVLRQKFREI
jgi:ParB family transcriptional regulator, chromosome partitioning protein